MESEMGEAETNAVIWEERKKLIEIRYVYDL